MREGRLPAFAFAAVDGDDRLIGTVRLWHVVDGSERPALLLGPLAVERLCRSLQVGGRLMRHALNRAALAGFWAVILVGDFAYYQRFGFVQGRLEGVSLPGPAERGRFLAVELCRDYLIGFSGCLSAAGVHDPLFAVTGPHTPASEWVTV